MAPVTFAAVIVPLLVWTGACSSAMDGEGTPTSPSGNSPAYEPPILQDSMSGRISAVGSAPCPNAFARSVHPNYYTQGTGRCVVFQRTSVTAGIVKAALTWPDHRVDIDLVLNDGVGTNFAQAIGGNICCHRLEAFVNAGTTYSFIVHLQGIDTFFTAGGGVYSGEVATTFTIDVERPR